MYPIHIPNQFIINQDTLNDVYGLMQQQNNQLLENALAWLKQPPENTQLVYENGKLYQLLGDGLELDNRITDLALRLLRNGLDDPFPLARTQFITRDAIIPRFSDPIYHLQVKKPLYPEDHQALVNYQRDKRFPITHRNSLTVNDLATAIFEQHSRTYVGEPYSHHSDQPRPRSPYHTQHHQPTTRLASFPTYHEPQPHTTPPEPHYPPASPHTFPTTPLQTRTASSTKYDSPPHARPVVDNTCEATPLTVSRYSESYPVTALPQSRPHHYSAPFTCRHFRNFTGRPKIIFSLLKQNPVTSPYQSRPYYHSEPSTWEPPACYPNSQTTVAPLSQIPRDNRSEPRQLSPRTHSNILKGGHRYPPALNNRNNNSIPETVQHFTFDQSLGNGDLYDSENGDGA